ncbi:MAG: sugar ABC transporter ATP-binding protein [Spirochaetaceae bacterium]|nr:sugar ABC transporter ATP-binding protein [Spirochaetaceae bacterium]GMO18477.1 MAG: sugar ABC transporter ATP-binding protein [Termitinemataceae bacterium]
MIENKHKSILEMKDISIGFPGVKALSNVDFRMESGKIYALIGANGAGKSTLMKVLSGVNSHYSGTVSIDGKKVEIRSPKKAKELGIEIVYQEVDVALSPSLSVAENIMSNYLVNKMGKSQFVDWRFIRAGAWEALMQLGIELDVRAPVSGLTLAEKQMVLLASAARERCKFLVLDEPTAPLSTTETENLFKVVRHLAKEENVGIVFISHRLAELFEICEHITVLRDGAVVADSDITSDLTINKIVEFMLGRKFEEAYNKTENQTGGTLLKIDNLGEAAGRVKNINLEVKEGEIVGIAGLVGAGKTELCKTIFGAYRAGSGSVLLRGKNITAKNPSIAVRNGLALVPEERRKEGIVVSDPVYANITISALDKFLNFFKFIVRRKQIEATRKMIDNLGIKTPSEFFETALLSGGNQQKIVVGKWLTADAEVYIFDEPTKGVDVGAKRDIFKLIEELAGRGKGIIYASCEFNEILAIANRAYVLFDGEIVKEVDVSKTNEKELLYYSTGGHNAK